MSTKIFVILFATTALVLLTVVMFFPQSETQADEFTEQDLARWQEEFMSVVNKGRELWVSPDLGTNGVACAQCHPNAANTHPETYPKFQQQLGKVIALRDMINWCLINPLEGKKLALDDPRMVAIEAYVTYERRGVPLEPGKH
jgi:thiosulfate dehydrogenase